MAAPKGAGRAQGAAAEGGAEEEEEEEDDEDEEMEDAEAQEGDGEAAAAVLRPPKEAKVTATIPAKVSLVSRPERWCGFRINGLLHSIVS